MDKNEFMFKVASDHLKRQLNGADSLTSKVNYLLAICGGSIALCCQGISNSKNASYMLALEMGVCGFILSGLCLLAALWIFNWWNPPSMKFVSYLSKSDETVDENLPEILKVMEDKYNENQDNEKIMARIVEVSICFIYLTVIVMGVIIFSGLS